MGRFLGTHPTAESESLAAPSAPETRRAGRARGRSGPAAPVRVALGCARLVLLVLQLALIGVFVAVLAAGAGYLYLNRELAGAINQVVAYQGQGPGGTPRFFDRNGTLLFELNTAEKRRWLNYDEIPPVVIDATVAVEDDTFWTNQGFDPEAIAAALLSNYRNPETRPVGASTITQQLVRHIVFSYEERVETSYDRKVKEVFLAFILTRQRSKQDIVAMYLNEIYYGNLAYGIEAAAQTYFAKPAADLTLAEAALLASLPQAPGEFDPYGDFEAVKGRQEFVLDLMADEGLIAPAAAAAAKALPLALAPLIPAEVAATTGPLEAPHFVLYVQRELEQRYGPEALIKGGWQVTTSLDLNLQHYAEQTARDWVAARAGQHDVNNAAVVALKPGTGEILAMVGSLDYFNEAIDGQVNVALSPRQPGSSIKPITYAAAMERGWTTGDVIWDVPIELDLGGGQKMTPVNYDGRYHGPLLLRDALANSYNIPPIQLIRDIGVPAFIGTARKMGVESLTEPPGYYGLALTLGGGEVPLLEMTHAFATLANMGQRPRLSSYLRIVDGRGGVVYDADRERIPPANALDPRIAYIITDILDDDAARIPGFGSGNPLAPSFPAAVKTGTTTDFRDNWVLGYTPGVAVGVWIGNTDGHPMRNSSGLTGAAPIWRTIIDHIYADNAIFNHLAVQGVAPQLEFPVPGGIEERTVCLPRGTGGAACSASRTDLFMIGGPVHGVQRLGYVPDTTTNPGAWTLAVAPLPAGNAALVNLPPLENGLRAPNPDLCVIGGWRPAGSGTRLFLPIPPFYPDEVRARIWAAQAGYSIAPPAGCPLGTGARAISGDGARDTSAGSGGGTVSSGTTARIDSPVAGQQVSGLVAVTGTASFNPAEIPYYKLEIGSGSAPDAWTTFGTTHTQSVTGGVLETLQANALPPGAYIIRLVLVRNDGNFATVHAVPITIVS